MERLKQMAAEQAHSELQKAYTILYCENEKTPPTPQEYQVAEKHLKRCNEWLSALKAG